MNSLAKKVTVALSTLALLPYIAHAQFGGALNKLDAVGKASGYDTDANNGGDLMGFIGSIVSKILGLLGIIAVLLMIYAGFLWMTAGGEEKKVTSAKNIIKNCIIGLIIISLAYAITSFVFQRLQCAGDVTACGGQSTITPGK